MGIEGMSIGSILLILVIILLLFGTKKLHRIGGDLGNAVRGFREAMHEGEERRVTPAEPESAEHVSPHATGASGKGSVVPAGKKPTPGAKAA